MTRPGKVAGSHIAVLTLLAVLAMWPAGASGVIVVGSDLTPAPKVTPVGCAPAADPCTMIQQRPRSGTSLPIKSPAGGTVKTFTIKANSPDTVTFRLARQKADPFGGTGAGTGPTVTLPGPGTFSYQVNLPIKAGSYIGIDASLTSASEALPCLNFAKTFLYAPLLVNGGGFQDVAANSACELLVQAVIAPGNQISIESQVLDINTNLAKLKAKLPGPGRVAVSGQAKGSRKVKKAGATVIPVKLAGKVLGKLERAGTGTAKVRITFSPTGGEPGTDRFKLKLRAR